MLFLPLEPGNDSRDLPGAPYVCGFGELAYDPDRVLTDPIRSLTSFFSPSLSLYVPPARALPQEHYGPGAAYGPVPRLRAQMDGLEPCPQRVTGMKW